MTLKSSFVDNIPPVAHQAPLVWLEEILSNRPQEDIATVMMAFDLVQCLDETKLTTCQLSCLAHGQALLTLGVQFAVDAPTLAVLMLYPATEMGLLEKSDIEEHFGTALAQLLFGALKLDLLEQSWWQPEQVQAAQADAMRRLLLAMVDDVRTVVVRLVVQVCRMYHLSHLPAESKQAIAQLSEQLYAPLANRLGMGQLKWQLEDLSFRVLAPDDYQRLREVVNERRDVRQAYVSQILLDLKKLCGPIGRFEMTGRVKHFRSIYSKMKRKQVDFNEVYDTLAVRVLVHNVDACYDVLSKIHHAYEAIAEEFDDYIAAPKANGYQSIHTAIKTDASHVVEVQIRTQKMHDFAECGVASHWLYKEGGAAAGGNVQDKVTWLNQLMDWQAELSETAQINYFHDRVFAFTPRGEVKDLPSGATPLDFAYAVHTAVGHGCRGAKVNGKMVALSTPLVNGDRVQIITGQQAQPSRDWLRAEPAVLRTASARAKVNQWFRRQDHAVMMERGQALLHHVLKSKVAGAKLAEVAELLGFSDVTAMTLALARHEITPTTILRRLSADVAEEAPVVKASASQKRSLQRSQASHHDAPILVEGLSGMMVYLAQCCHPLPGDDIVGRVSRSRGVVVHCRSCPQVVEVLLKQDRMLSVAWADEARQHRFSARLKLYLQDAHAEQAVQQWLANQDIAWTQWHVDRLSHSAGLLLHVQVSLASESVLQQCLLGLRQCKGVLSVKRALNA